MKITVTKKGDGHKLAGIYRKQGDVIETESRNARVWCAVGFTTKEMAPVKKVAKKKAHKKPKPVYATKVMEAEKPRDKDE